MTHTLAAHTKRACEAATLMGATITENVQRAEPAPIPSDDALLDSPITLITGPSGAGKTTVLRHARQRLETRGVKTVDPDALRPADKPAVDLLARDTQRAMRALAEVGLAELRCFVRRPRELSAGQRARLRIALAVDRAPRTRAAAIIIDEFASSLDDLTARTLAQLIRRLAAKHTNLRFIIATNRDRLARHIAPNTHLHVDLTGQITTRRTAPAPIMPIDIAEGRRADLQALAHHHYRAGLPATIERVIRAIDRETGTLAGVLAISRPTLNGAWRAHAWPGRFNAKDKSANARAINRDLRTISRVIVDPRFRAVGLAKSLVRGYLRNPDTDCTEAIAAMGAVCPFFASAGMVTHTITRRPADERLIRALRDAGVETWRLATPDLALARALRNAGEHTIDRELRIWARASASTSKRADAPIQTIFNRACTALAAPPIAYTHTKHP